MPRFFITLLLLLCLAACATTPRPTLTQCTVPGVDRVAVCGTIDVPEDRAHPQGRHIALNVAIVKARENTAADPLVLLAGGPGQGAVETARAVVPELEPLLAHRDLVLIDQRGTGKSNPLTCAGGFALVEPSRKDDLARCVDELQRKSDLRQYTTDVAAEDLRVAFDALGYKRVNLVAASYGTRAAFVFMRRYPQRVRTAVLRAVAPSGFNILADGAANFSRQLDQLVADCAQDAKCSAAYPHLDAELATLRKDAPMLLHQTLYALLLSGASRQSLPYLIHNPEKLAPVEKQVETAVYGTLPVGMYLSVVCAEDAPRVTSENKQQMVRAFGEFGESIVDACALWPQGRVAPELLRTDAIDVPTIIISGAADPATPPESGQAAMRQLRHGVPVVAPATAHAPMLPGCAREAVQQFVESGGSAAIDTSCINALTWGAFAVPPR
ncbi:MAG TPA: alpha/beta fold hydrolase [Thermoanaerobaculia bacterium]|nr:alpha/beta fold hydrolase [Thermoanaerobaculia bacterium]